MPTKVRWFHELFICSARRIKANDSTSPKPVTLDRVTSRSRRHFFRIAPLLLFITPGVQGPKLAQTRIATYTVDHKACSGASLRRLTCMLFIANLLMRACSQVWGMLRRRHPLHRGVRVPFNASSLARATHCLYAPSSACWNLSYWSARCICSRQYRTALVDPNFSGQLRNQ